MKKFSNLFKSRKSRSLSRSETDPSSFSSSSSEDSSIKKPSTPTSVLPEISPDEWFEISVDVYLDLEQAFETIDRDGDGNIQREELEVLLCGLGAEHPPSREELRLMLTEVDGYVTLEEFYAIGSAFEAPPGDAELRD